MTHRPEAALDRRIVTRWRELAERRLDHLTDLRESGRWRRYYSEASFVADLHDAERAVAAWQLLAPRDAEPAAAEAASFDACRVDVDSSAAWRTTLPPVGFLANDVAVEGDLRQA